MSNDCLIVHVMYLRILWKLFLFLCTLLFVSHVRSVISTNVLL